MLHGDLNDGNAKGGDVSIHRADSPCWTAETQHCKATVLQ